MKTASWIKKISTYILVIGSILLGGYVALITVQAYAHIAQAILGSIVIYFIFQKYIWASLMESNEKDNFDLLFDYPQNIKYLIFGFTICLVGTWAILQIVYMLIFYIKGH